jgi:RNA polymerase sigma-70 factor, ECF subfamily
MGISGADGTYSFKTDLIAQLPAMRAFAVSLCGKADVADDLVQDALMNAWAKQASFQPGTNIKAWLFTIVRNLFYSRMRKRGREIQDSDGIFTERLSVPPAQNGNLDMQDFKTALAKLPEDQREAIILIGATGLSYEEAAAVCGCAIGTIKSRVNRARHRLQELLSVSGAEDFGPDARDASITQRAFAG